MKRVLALFLLVACTSTGAEVFRQVGPDGEVSFSDRPGPGAEPVDVGPLQTIDLPPVSPRATATEQSSDDAADGEKSPPSYARFAITEPSNGQSIRANDGSVTISVSLQPALVPGHTIELILDGEDGGRVYSGSALNFKLGELSRGQHTVIARVKNGRGEKLVETGPVSFYVLRVAAGG